MLRQPIKTRSTVVLGVVSVLIMFAAYTVISNWQHEKNPDDTTIPTWNQIGDGVKKAVEVNPRSGERWVLVDMEATGTRLFLGLLVGIIGALTLGVLMGCFSTVEAFFIVPLSLLAKVPPTAALAVFFVLVGTDTEMYIAMIAFGIMPILAQSIYLSVRDVPAELLYKAYTIGASTGEVIWNIIVRAILPQIIDTIRLQIGPAMVFLIAAEMVCGDVGFGYRIRLQSRLLNMNVVYFYLALLAAFGFAIDYGLRLIQKICCPWYVQGKR